MFVKVGSGKYAAFAYGLARFSIHFPPFPSSVCTPKLFIWHKESDLVLFHQLNETKKVKFSVWTFGTGSHFTIMKGTVLGGFSGVLLEFGFVSFYWIVDFAVFQCFNFLCSTWLTKMIVHLGLKYCAHFCWVNVLVPLQFSIWLHLTPNHLTHSNFTQLGMSRVTPISSSFDTWRHLVPLETHTFFLEHLYSFTAASAPIIGGAVPLQRISFLSWVM